MCPVLEGSAAENIRLGWIGKDGKWVIAPKFAGGAGGPAGSLSPAVIGEKLGTGGGSS